MTRVTSAVVTYRRHEYRVPNPCYWKDVHDAFMQAINDASAVFEVRDDGIRVEARDEEIVAYWIEEVKDDPNPT